MLPHLPRWWQLTEKIAVGAWRGLRRQGGITGREPRSASCSQLTFFVTSPCSHTKGPAEPEQCRQRNAKPLKEWTLVVSPFGQLKVRLPCHVTVCPLDPHEYPNADRVFVTVSGQNTHRGADLDSVHVKYDEAQKEMAILSNDMDSTASVDVRIPVKFDLDIKTSGNGCVKIEKIECESCRIETEKGTSILQSVKSVDIEKLQGSSVNISTKDGSLKTRYLYAQSSFMSSAAGDILLGNVHGTTILQTKTGNITVDSSEGFLKASTHQGEIDIYTLSQEGEVDLKSQNGSITVRVPATLEAHLHLSGNKVDVSPELQLQEIQNVSREGHVMVTGHLNQRKEKEKRIKADTQNGTVHVKSQTWFQSVKLKAPF
ncbi:protein FAM185A isoform X2 [Eublepharis macularius]|uniref:Protein FAM185A isoform X2 n=1 Tax=Eublepharis macularius TaxID=481883 RepID=A0AA97JTK2_EUBMA|nr:protein FAM185A isoform X2 [Eublepharis macularius]